MSQAQAAPRQTPEATSTTDSTKAFGSVFTPKMSVCHFRDGAWQDANLEPTAPFSMHPAAHVLHYASACFEGLKAYHHPDGRIRMFRPGLHVERMRHSAELLCLPIPPSELLSGMLHDLVAASRDEVPEPPGALYLRPTLIGVDPNVGAAGAPSNDALLYVLASPVGDYFGGAMKTLRVLIEDKTPRTTPQFGMVKCGANYVQAVGQTMQARKNFGADTVLFCPDGDAQETGASNFMLMDDKRLVTKALDGSFLHGVTRASVLELARDLGYEVEERDVSVREILEWSKHGEAALSGTAAVLGGVGTFIHDGKEHQVGGGQVGPNVRRLREALSAIQVGAAEDRHGWLVEVDC